MSDVPPKLTPAEKERQKLLDTREKSQVEPDIKSKDIFDWLEEMFYGPSEFPEKIEVNVVTGTKFDRIGAIIKQILYPPKSPKPSREEMVSLSNQLVFLMQRDTDIQGRSVVYGLHAWHSLRGAFPYDRLLQRFYPSPRNSRDGIPRPADDGDEPNHTMAGIQAQMSVQVMNHGERMFALYGGGYEGLLDRQDRALERLFDRIDKLEARNEKMSEQMERALSLEQDRHDRREWNALKIRSAEKALDLGLMLAPPLINQITGKQLVATADSNEAIILRNFFKKVGKEGGKLTEEQAVLAFGSDEGHPGVLRVEQTKILYDVAHCRVPVSELDKVMPGGPLEITTEQAMALATQCGFSLEQIAPIQMLFNARMRQNGKANG